MCSIKRNLLIEIENYLLERHGGKLYFMPSPKDVYYKLDELEFKDYADFVIKMRARRLKCLV